MAPTRRPPRPPPSPLQLAAVLVLSKMLLTWLRRLDADSNLRAADLGLDDPGSLKKVQRARRLLLLLSGRLPAAPAAVPTGVDILGPPRRARACVLSARTRCGRLSQPFPHPEPRLPAQVPCPSIFGEASKSLSIVIPAYNEEERLPATLVETLR